MSSIRPLTELNRLRAANPGGPNLSLWPPTEQSANGGRPDALGRVIETEIIPRLLLAHRQAQTSNTLAEREAIEVRDVENFVSILLFDTLPSARAFVERCSDRGVPLEDVLLGLFSPAARHLGELWVHDICTFTDVTIALSKLQQLLRELAPTFTRDVPFARNAPRAFLAVLPGDQHTFGLLLVQEFFRRSGWHVSGGVYRSNSELVADVAREPYDVVGLSIGCDPRLADLDEIVGRLKAKTLQRQQPRVLVGGRFVLENPEIVAQVGADGTATDGRAAVPSCQVSLT